MLLNINEIYNISIVLILIEKIDLMILIQSFISLNTLMLSFNLYIAIACAENYFGSKCQQQCGNCKNGDVCNHVTGLCSTGCAEGWIGSRCNIGKTTCIWKSQFRLFDMSNVSLNNKLFSSYIS